MNSSDLKNVHSSIILTLGFPVIQEKLNALCDEIASAEFYDHSGEMIRKTIQSWRDYDIANHTITESRMVAKSCISSLKKNIEMDTKESDEEVNDEDKRTKGRRLKVTGVGLLSLVTTAIAPAAGMTGLTTTAGQALTMNDNLKAQKKRNRAIKERNNRYIRELDSIMKLFWIICLNNVIWQLHPELFNTND